MIETEKRDWLGNAGLFITSALGFVFIASLVATLLNKLFVGGLNNSLLSIIGSIVYIVLMFLLYYKDLIKEAKIYKESFGKCLSKGLWYYFIGLLIMIVSNIIISFVIKDVSANENQVRNMLYQTPVLTMISIVIIAPLTEELLFRKSLMPLVKNKWLYALVSGLLFGGAHLIAGLSAFKLIDLLYLIPYGSLGFVFALANSETKTTFTSITVHAFHNFVTGILLLLIYFSGVLK